MVGVTSIVCSYLHMVYSADSVAATVGYYVAIVIPPVIVGVALGLVGVSVINRLTIKNIKTYWSTPATGIITSLIPVLFVLFLMPLLGH